MKMSELNAGWEHFMGMDFGLSEKDKDQYFLVESDSGCIFLCTYLEDECKHVANYTDGLSTLVRTEQDKCFDTICEVFFQWREIQASPYKVGGHLYGVYDE